MKKGRGFSFYLGNPVLPFLLDLVAERRKFKSRSEILNTIIEELCIEDNLLDKKTGKPTEKALKMSRPLRKFLDELAEAEKKAQEQPKVEEPREALRQSLQALKRRVKKLKVPT